MAVWIQNVQYVVMGYSELRKHVLSISYNFESLFM